MLWSWSVAGQAELRRLPSTDEKTSLAQDLSDALDSNLSDFHEQDNLATANSGPPLDLKNLLRPWFNLSAEWAPEVDGFTIASHDLSMRVPFYPVFGPPPPIITSGYSLTQVDAPGGFDLPSNLHEFSLGVGWMRPINEKWMARLMLSGAFASDLENNSSDAWQVRGGGFAIYRPNDRWSLALGALATGRDDLPVLPAVGAIWEPVPDVRVNLMMPTPRVSFLLRETVTRQHWGFIGAGIMGGTWAYNSAVGDGDRISYNEFQLTLGWESTPPQLPGTFRPSGKTISVEFGYAFGRDFEFESNAPEISFGDALLIRSQFSF